MTSRTRRAAPKPANTPVSGKKRKASRTAWKPGQSGNPAGAPKRGESWAELWKKIGNLTPSEAADYCRTIAGQLATIGNNITLKEAVVLRVYAALMFEPDARLLNAVMDRDEGKVKQGLEISGELATRNDSELVDEFTDIIHTARARAGAGDSGGTPAAGAGGADKSA